MPSNPRVFSSLMLVVILLISPLTHLVSGTQSDWSGPPVVTFSEGGGNITVSGFSLPEGEAVLDSWVRISEDGMSELNAGPVWRADAPGALNFSWGLWDNSTANYFDGSLSLAANHSVGRVNDFETLTRTLQDWNMGGTPGIWEVDDMLGIPGSINGSGRESSGGLIPIGAVTGRYIVATRADQALPSGVHTWMESPDFFVPAVINDFNLTFSHWQHMYTPSDGNGLADGAWVEASLDGGQNWSYITPVGGYNNLISSAAPPPSGVSGAPFPVWASVNASGWQTAEFHLDNMAGIANASSIRFRFVAWTDSNSTVQRPGWFLDNVNLTNSGADPGSWFHGNLSGYYADGAESVLTFPVNLSNASGPIMLDYAVDFDMEGDIYDNFRWQWSLNNFTWTPFSADMPGFGVLIDGQMYIDDSRGWKHLAHPLPQSLSGNSTVYIRLHLETDAFPGSGFGGLALDPPEGLFLDDVTISSGTGANNTVHLNLNFTNISTGGVTHSAIGNAINEWQYLPDYGVNGPTYQADSFENSPLLPEGWTVQTDRGSGWEFRAHDASALYGPDTPSNGSYYAGIVFDDVYEANTWTHLTSPALAIPAGSHASLSFDQFICAEVAWDGGVVYISDDDGRTWNPYGQNEPEFYETLQTMNVQSDIYNLFAMDGSNTKPSCHGQRGSGANKSWQTKQIDVSQYGGKSIQVRFSFFTDQMVVSDGWYLDNVGIYVDWFEGYGTWISDPIYPQDLLGLDAIEIDADIPNGTWVKATVLYSGNLEGANPWYTNLSLPATLVGLEGDGYVNSTDSIQIKLEMGTDVAQLTPRVHALHLGATRVLNPSNMVGSGWTASPALNINSTSGNITNPVMATQTITSTPLIPSHPLSSLRVSGHGAGVLLTFRDEAGATIASGYLANNTVQATTPFSLFTVEVAIQPGGWLSHLEVEGVRLSPAVGASVDIGDDGTAEWQWGGYTAWGALGWQTQAYYYPGWSDPIWEPCEICMYAYGPTYNGTSSRRLSIPLYSQLGGGWLSNYSFAIPSDASPRGMTLLVRLLDQSDDAVPENTTFTLSGGGQTISSFTDSTPEALIHLTPMLLSQLNQTSFTSTNNQSERDWTEYHMDLNIQFNGTPSDNPIAEINLLSVEYDYTENLTGLAPLISTLMNSTNPINGSHNLPVSVGAWQGGVGIWGSIDHAPLITNEFTTLPTTFVPDREMTVISTHSHLFDGGILSTANLTILSPTGETIALTVEDLENGGLFSQTGGGGMLALNTSASAVTRLNNSWVVAWVLKTSWGWDDVDWLDLTLHSVTTSGEVVGSPASRMGIGGVAVENDMEIDSFEVRSADGRVLSDGTSPFYPFEIAVGATVEVSGTIRFEDTTLRPNGDDYQLVVEIAGEEMRTVQVIGGEDGDWNASIRLTETEGEVELSAWIIRPGPSGVPLTGATDATKNRVITTVIMDSNPPILASLMAHTPSGPRLADGNVWPENRPLPISVVVHEPEALGSAIFLYYWRGGIDDVDDDGVADDWEYSLFREITPLKASGEVTIHFPAIDLVANGENNPVSLYVSGTDLAGHPLVGGGAAGVANDMATITTQADQPTSISLPSITLDRWGDNLLAGVEHQFTFELQDGNGILSLDNITVSLAGDDPAGEIWFNGLAATPNTHIGSPINPHSISISETEAGIYSIALTFSIGLNAPPAWNYTPMSPGILVTEHGQSLELGTSSLYPLAWRLDPRVRITLSETTDLTSPTSQGGNTALYLMSDDEFQVSGMLSHAANSAPVRLAGEWNISLNMDDGKGHTHTWQTALLDGGNFTTTERVLSTIWSEGEVTLTHTLVGGTQTVVTPPLEHLLIIDNTAPIVEFPENTLVTMNTDRMMQQLVTVRLLERAGMAGDSLNLNWTFRRYGVDIPGLSGSSALTLATSSGELWTYSSRVDFDIDTQQLRPGDELVIWVHGSDLAGHAVVGEGSEAQARLVTLQVIYFHPLLSGLVAEPERPVVDAVVMIEGRVTNYGNEAGGVKVALWTWQSSGGGGRYIILNETNVTLLPQQHQLFSFEIDAWKSGDLQLYIALDDDSANLTSVPLGMVREKTTGEVILANLNSPAAAGLLILLTIMLVMVAFALSRKDDEEWDEEYEDDSGLAFEDEEGAIHTAGDSDEPPPPPWPADDWPEGAGPPPEILTSPLSREEEE